MSISCSWGQQVMILRDFYREYIPSITDKLLLDDNNGNIQNFTYQYITTGKKK